MDSWVSELADKFNPELSRLYFASDPDDLLSVPDVQAALRQRGFDLVRYDDPVEFRYLFEYQIRPQLLDDASSAIVVDTGERPRAEIPYDMLQLARFVEASLYRFVPKLSPVAMGDVPREHLGRVITAVSTYTGPQMGEQATRDFLLREVYGVVPASLSRSDAYAEYLLRRHYSGEVLPESLDRMLASQIAPQLDLGADIFALLRSPDAFYGWLQSDWTGYVRARTGLQLREEQVPYEVPEIRVYLDNLFTEGLLEPVRLEEGELPSWMRPGVSLPQDDPDRRFWDLIHKLDETWPGPGASHRDWIAFAWKWAEARARLGAASEDVRPEMLSALRQIQQPSESAFAAWMYECYAGLAMLPVTGGPNMVHQIASRLQRSLVRNHRVALLVIDGLALDHWLAIRSLHPEWSERWQIEQGGCFAWVPTLTSISRQSIFSGRIPMAFSESWNTTAAEKSHWQRLGRDSGLSDSAIYYGHLRLDTMAAGEDPITYLPQADDSRIRLLGLVINDLDELGHASKLGMLGMQDDVRLWSASNRLSDLVRGLLDRGFVVHIATDHGSVEAVGAGQPKEGVLVEQRAARARIYEADEFADAILRDYPHARKWPGYGLPSQLQVLLADDLTAFAPTGEMIVAHGGLSIEEVIVPFVEIRSK